MPCLAQNLWKDLLTIIPLCLLWLHMPHDMYYAIRLEQHSQHMVVWLQTNKRRFLLSDDCKVSVKLGVTSRDFVFFLRPSVWQLCTLVCRTFFELTSQHLSSLVSCCGMTRKSPLGCPPRQLILTFALCLSKNPLLTTRAPYFLCVGGEVCIGLQALGLAVALESLLSENAIPRLSAESPRVDWLLNKRLASAYEKTQT